MLTTPTSADSAAHTADLEALQRLNGDYIQSVIDSDVRRFNELLAADFLCSLPDGSLIDRAEFLRRTAAPYQSTALEAHDVQVRLIGEMAIVHARTTFVHADGTPGAGRYTDIWAKHDGAWRAVAAHFTRV
jgi:ketosteroid isomerase-like protein